MLVLFADSPAIDGHNQPQPVEHAHRDAVRSGFQKLLAGMMIRLKMLRPVLQAAEEPVDFVFRKSAPIIGSARDYCSLAYSALACFRMGMSSSASFHNARKS